MRPPRHHLSLVLCALCPGLARGDEPPAPAQPGEVIEVRGVAPSVGEVADLVGDDPAALAGADALAEPAFVTRVRLDRRAGEQLALAELVRESVGATVRALGGLGSFATLSVRGAAPGHTQVVVDGVPLSRLGSAAADLGRLGLDGFAVVELYRGGAPGQLGGAAGSALHLISEVGPPADGHPLRLAAGLGSLGERHLAVRWLGGDDALGWLAAASYAGARGDFAYFDDRGTNLTTRDDRTQTRQNAGFDALDASARVRRRAALALDGGLRLGWRRQGIPGPGSAQSTRASLATLRQTLDGSLRQSGLAAGRAALGVTAYGFVEHQRYRDRDGEIGLAAQDRRYLTLAAGATAGGDLALGDHQRGSASVELRAERFDEEDRLGEVPRGAAGRRLGAALELTDELASARALIRPAVRLEAVRTQAPPNFDEGTGPRQPTRRDDVVVAPRLHARVLVGDGVAFKGGVQRYLRLPTALELFGDRGVVVGNPHLASERGWSAEAGVVVAPERRLGAVDRVHLEVVGFATASQDTIALVPTAALVVAPQNLGGARVLGAELAAAVRLGRALSLALGYTAMVSRQRGGLPSYRDKELPHRPRHRLYARADLAIRRWGRLGVLWSDLDVTAGSQLDPANLEEVPRRSLVGLGAKAEAMPGLLIGVELENLFDDRIEDVTLDPPPRPDLTRVPRAIADFYGYPLPGRAAYLTIEWEP